MKKLEKKFEELVLANLNKVIALYKKEFPSKTEALEAIGSLGLSCEYLIYDVLEGEKNGTTTN